jgi:peroxiredoxin
MTETRSSTLAPGDSAPDFSLPATDGKTYSLPDFAGASAFSVVFLANHCPYVSSWEERLTAIAREYGDRGVRFAGISSNDASKQPKDSFEAMGRRVQEQHYPFPYLYDEDGAVARSFGATRTPEVFLFDRDSVLRYHGAIDSDWEEGDDRDEYLRDSLDAVLAGQPIETAETRAVGCVIKTKS